MTGHARQREPKYGIAWETKDGVERQTGKTLGNTYTAKRDAQEAARRLNRVARGPYAGGRYVVVDL